MDKPNGYDLLLIEDLKAKYLLVLNLLNDDSKNDNENEPYKTKYNAFKILQEMHQILLDTHNTTYLSESKKSSMLSVIFLNLGIISLETEELKQGEDYLLNCIEVLNNDGTKSDTILPMISALNQLGILWSKQDQISKAKEFLEKAEKIFIDFKELQDPDDSPKNMTNIFEIEDLDEPPASDTLEKLHTLTLYYLAQIYGTLKDCLKSAIYCFMTLKRQLDSGDYDHVEWALNAATLSQFFMEKAGFYQARHLLSAATLILEKFEDKLKESELKDDIDLEIMDSKWSNYKHRTADVSRCWAKYGILLLSMSKDRLVAKIESSEEKPIVEIDSKLIMNLNCLNNLKFEKIEVEVELIASNVTDKYLLDFKDAKVVFLNVQKWLEKAKLFYTLKDQASDHVEIIQDMSQAYKYLSFFEENEDRQAKMHKRRIDLLEGVLEEINEKYYGSTCQQIWIELGETFSEILDIKLDRLKSNHERPSPRMLVKINNLAKFAIKYFTKFLHSLKFSKNGTFPEEMLRPALCAYFHLGRLYNKFITLDKSVQLENIKKSLEAYTFIVNYCERDERFEEIMRLEIGICKDFMKLLPIKMNKLMREISA